MSQLPNFVFDEFYEFNETGFASPMNGRIAGDLYLESQPCAHHSGIVPKVEICDVPATSGALDPVQAGRKALRRQNAPGLPHRAISAGGADSAAKQG